jgi:hypothetical protein
MPEWERLSPSSNGGDDAQVFPDCSCSFVCQPTSAQRPDASALAARRQAEMQQKMMMQKQMMMRKQMAMQREMQRHPIRTRVHFALLNFKRKLHYAFH